MKAVVSEKGQVTIPKPLRDRLDIVPGDALEFSEHDGRLIATKTGPTDAVDEVYGILDLGRSTDDFVNQVRGVPGQA